MRCLRFADSDPTLCVNLVRDTATIRFEARNSKESRSCRIDYVILAASGEELYTFVPSGTQFR